MRALVVGISGAGKTTFARRLSEMAQAPHIELDLLNWGPDWHDRHLHEPQAFIAAVDEASRAPRWVIAGSYHSTVGEMLWARATDIVWIDPPRGVVMRQVIGRSLNRVITGSEVFPGCRETWGRLLTKGHPIRFAWDNYARRRARIAALVADPRHAHLRVHRCQTRAECAQALDTISRRCA